MSVSFKVVSDSMEPVIKIGDLLTVSAEKNSFKVFDIIVFKRSSELFVHFVWRNQSRFNKTIITRSIKNIYCDEEPVQLNDITGTVTNFNISFFLKLKILILCFLTGRL